MSRHCAPVTTELDDAGSLVVISVPVVVVGAELGNPSAINDRRLMLSQASGHPSEAAVKYAERAYADAEQSINGGCAAVVTYTLRCGDFLRCLCGGL